MTGPNPVLEMVRAYGGDVNLERPGSPVVAEAIRHWAPWKQAIMLADDPLPIARTVVDGYAGSQTMIGLHPSRRAQRDRMIDEVRQRLYVRSLVAAHEARKLPADAGRVEIVEGSA